MPNVNKRIPQISSIKNAIDVYWSKPDFNTSDIAKIFGCCPNTARRLKGIVRDYMVEKGIQFYTEGCVNGKEAFEAWGLDIKDLEYRQKKLEQLEGKKNA